MNIKIVYEKEREREVKEILKLIWSKGLIARICAFSLATVLIGGVTTGVVLLQNRKDEKSNNHVVEEKNDKEKESYETEKNDNENEEEQVNKESSESTSKEQTSQTNVASKPLKTEQNNQSTPQEITTEQKQETQPSVSQKEIDAQRLMNQVYRKELLEYWTTIFRFGLVDINGDGAEELLLYTYDTTMERDNGPNVMLQYEYDPIYGGGAYGAGKGFGYLKNIEYCAKSQHFITTRYYDDGSYDFCIYEFPDNSTYGPEHIRDDEGKDWAFAFHVDANGKYSYGDQDTLYYSQKLTDDQRDYVVQKINEFLPTRTKATASHLVTQENLDKYLPIDDKGIIRQLMNKN